MKSKIALITGANRGIGKAIALDFASKGYLLLLLARNEKQLISLKNEIQSKYQNTPEPKLFICDFNDLKELEKTMVKVTKSYTNIDILVNNAGKFIEGSLEGSIDSFKDLLQINLTAPLLILKHIVPQMKENKQGYIFNIASRAGKIGFANSGFYVASKFGLVGLSESLYRELAEFNIKVSTICPSYTNTDMAIEANSTLESHQMIQTEDISKTLVWLMSLSASAAVKEVIIECQSTIN